MSRRIRVLTSALVCAAATGSVLGVGQLPAQQVTVDPYASTYRPPPSATTLIRGGTIFTAAGEVIEQGDVLLEGGRVAAVGRQLPVPANAVIVDATGRYVTPGLIDSHSHLGVGPTPRIPALSDTNEMTAPVTAQLWAEHSIWPHDPGFARALAGGVTSLQLLPGSANLIGGRTVTVRNVPANTVQEMKYPGAPHGLKMACGENPKRVYGGRNQAPATSMANMAGFRAAWIEATEYRDRWDRWANGDRRPADRPARRLDMETLAGVLRGEILVHNHCYRSDEMAWMIDMAREFGYRIRSFHHAVEAYKIPDLLVREGISTSVWADWWGFKMEAMDMVVAAAAISHVNGVRVIIHSDDAQGIQRLNQETAKVLGAAHEMGLEISDDDAIRWITANPAWALGIDEDTGTLETGKRGDVVVWSGHPFSIYTRAERVYMDGALVFDLADPARQPASDFDIGFTPRGGAR
jgi:imidazolonepropionase-like amidohydrolase